MNRILLLLLLLLPTSLLAQVTPQLPANSIPCNSTSGASFVVPCTLGTGIAFNGSTLNLASISTGAVLGNYSGVSGAPTAQNAVLISTVTSGGILYGSSSAVLSSSGVLGLNELVLGGGAGGAPASLTGSGVPVLASGVVTVDAVLPSANGGCAQPIATSNTGCGQRLRKHRSRLSVSTRHRGHTDYGQLQHINRVQLVAAMPRRLQQQRRVGRGYAQCVHDV